MPKTSDNRVFITLRLNVFELPRLGSTIFFRSRTIFKIFKKLYYSIVTAKRR